MTKENNSELVRAQLAEAVALKKPAPSPLIENIVEEKPRLIDQSKEERTQTSNNVT